MVCIAMVMVCITQFSDCGRALLVIVSVFEGLFVAFGYVCTAVEYG